MSAHQIGLKMPRLNGSIGILAGWFMNLPTFGNITTVVCLFRWKGIRTRSFALLTKGMLVRQLIEQNGSMSFTRFCEEMAGGMEPGQAFEAAFGVSVQDFRKKFKRDTLGLLADCTPATCKVPKIELGTYSIEEMFDPNT